MAHDALYKRAALLDQFKEGLKKIGTFQLISMFSQEMSVLFIYQGKLTSDEVKRALYIDEEEELRPENEVVFNFLLHFVDTLKEEGMFIVYSKNNAMHDTIVVCTCVASFKITFLIFLQN